MEIKVENAISVGRSGEEGRNFDKIFEFLQGQVSIWGQNQFKDHLIKER